MFDFGFNAGVDCSARLLQNTLGLHGAAVDGIVGPITTAIAATPDWPPLLARLEPGFVAELQVATDIPVDGIAGPVTRAALAAAPALWPAALARLLAQEQLAAYRRMRGWGAFGAGWEARTARRLAASLAIQADTLGFRASPAIRRPRRHHRRTPPLRSIADPAAR